MSHASEEMLDVMWRLAAVGTDVETSVLLYSALIYFIEFIHEVYRYTNSYINTVISNI